MYFYFDFNNFLIFLMVGLIAGFVANNLVGKPNSSLLANLLIGVAGAFIGGLLMPGLGIRIGGVIGNIVSATFGAVILVGLARLLHESNSRV